MGERPFRPSVRPLPPSRAAPRLRTAEARAAFEAMRSASPRTCSGRVIHE
jgi:hypothetical protein